jgi:energy-coupling factor transporter ATP-binding protein EcfA2
MPSQAGYLDLSAIAPRVAGKQGADRMFIVGRSGSGKTYLARALLDLYDDDEKTLTQFRARICVFDPNGTFDYPGRIVHDPADVGPSRHHPVVIYRPGVAHLNAEDWNEALKRLFYAKGRILLLIDEFTALDTLFGSRRIEGGNYLTAYMSRGRALGKAAVIVTQAPSSIPLTVIRNAERFAVFDLPLEDDRDRMAGVLGRYTTEVHNGEVLRVDLRDRKALGRFQFWYLGPGVEEPVRIRVKG